VDVRVEPSETASSVRVRWTYRRDKLRRALARDGAYLLLSDRTQWGPQDLWTLYVQLTRAEAAFRAMKSHLLLRPMHHQRAARVEAHVFVCVLAYALWKGLDHLLGRAGLMTRVRKGDEDGEAARPADRPMSPAAALRIMHRIQIGDILLETVEVRTLRLRRVARPDEEQAEVLAGLGLCLPERICADVDVTTDDPVPPASLS